MSVDAAREPSLGLWETGSLLEDVGLEGREWGLQELCCRLMDSGGNTEMGGIGPGGGGLDSEAPKISDIRL